MSTKSLFICMIVFTGVSAILLAIDFVLLIIKYINEN